MKAKRKSKKKSSRFFKNPSEPLGLSNLTPEGTDFYWAADEYISRLYSKEMKKQFDMQEVQRIILYLCDWHAWVYTLKNSTSYKEAKLRQWLLEKRLRDDAAAADSPEEDRLSLSERLIQSVISPAISPSSSSSPKKKKRFRRMSRGMRSRKSRPR